MSEKVLKYIILILSLILFSLSGYRIYEYFSFKENAENENNNHQEDINNNNNEMDSEESKDFDISEAEEILEYFGFNDDLGCGSLIYNQIYDDEYKRIQAIKKVEKSKINVMNCSNIYSETELDQYGRYNLKYGVCEKDKETSVISYDDVNQIYQDMYGKQMEKDGMSSGWFHNQFYDYNETLKAFVKTECGACGGACGANYRINKIKSAKTIGDNLIIEVYYLHGSPIITQSNIYRLETKKITTDIKADGIDSFIQEVLNNYLDKLDIYEIRFEKENNNFVLKDVSSKIS